MTITMGITKLLLPILISISLVAGQEVEGIGRLERTQVRQRERLQGLNVTVLNNTRTLQRLIHGTVIVKASVKARLEAQDRKIQNQTHVYNELVDALKGGRSDIYAKFAELQRKLLSGSSGKSAAGKSCPDDGFRPFNKSCYFFGRLPVTRSDAKRHCERMNATLAEVHSYAEDQFIIKTIHRLDTKLGVELFEGVDTFFTGGIDLNSNGNWIWQTSRRPMGYTNWARDMGLRTYLNSNKVHVYKKGSFQWHDILVIARFSDEATGGFICQKRMQ